MNLTVTGYSTALFSTWILIEELGVLFDAGDGVVAGLAQKSRKAKHVFISHADRDHLTGLLQLNQLNAGGGFPKIYYPRDCGSFPALAAFAAKFDPHVTTCEWRGISTGARINLRPNICVVPFENRHVADDNGKNKSLGFHIVLTKQKLKAAFSTLPGKEIARLRNERGDEHVCDIVEESVLTYSGDTPVFEGPHWTKGGILIHEATFIDRADAAGPTNQAERHSVLEDVIARAADSPISALALTHFSIRYKPDRIDKEIRDTCKRFNVSFPVYRILPGEITRDLFGHPPLFQP